MCNLEFSHGLHFIFTYFGFIFLFRKRRLSNTYQVNKDIDECDKWICAFLYRHQDKSSSSSLLMPPGAHFLKLPVITGPVKLFCFPFQIYRSVKSFENCIINVSAKETKWTSLEVRTHLFMRLISKYDFRPVKLLVLSKNGPQSHKVPPV